jgi:hypothetical protein
MSDDWDEFLQYVSWFDQQAVQEVEPAEPAGRRAFRSDAAFLTLFPQLAVLLGSATVTPLRVSGRRNYLFAWTGRQGRMGWLCEAPFAGQSSLRLHGDHLTLLRSFGGVTERFNEPNSWLLNLNSALVERACKEGVGPAWDDYYRERCQDEGLRPAVRSHDHVAFAFEANGNMTLYHRETAEVLLFATDHAFAHVETLPGCPPYTYHRIKGCRTLKDWVEAVATQWLPHLA